jgi:hypothetical protein
MNEARKLVAAAFLVLFGFHVPAWGALGDIVASYKSPPQYPRALARSNAYLFAYCVDNSATPPGWVFRLVPLSGRVVASFPLNHESATMYRGLTFTGPDNLWIGHSTDDRVYRLNAANGSVRSSWPVISGIIWGLAAEYDQAGGGPVRGLWMSGANPVAATCYSTTGSIKQVFLWSTQTLDIGWDYNHDLLWGSVLKSVPYYVCGFTTDGSIVASFPSPAGGDEAIAGCAFYEGYLWLSAYRTQAGNDPYIWQADVRDLTGVSPASLGRVKALFR